LRPRRSEFDFQGYVNGKLVFNGHLIGVPIHKEQAAAELGE
jgi:hypothetical protein